MSNNADENQKFGEKVKFFNNNLLSDSQKTFKLTYLARCDSPSLRCDFCIEARVAAYF